MADQPNHEARRWREKFRALRRQHQESEARYQASEENLSEALAALEETEAERADFQARFEAEPDDKDATIRELQGKLRTIEHRKVFDRLAGEAKVRPEALEDAWARMAYEADSDDVDESALSERLGEVLATRAYMLAPEGDGVAVARRPAPDGAHRGRVDAPPARLPEGPGGSGGSRAGGSGADIQSIISSRLAHRGDGGHSAEGRIA